MARKKLAKAESVSQGITSSAEAAQPKEDNMSALTLEQMIEAGGDLADMIQAAEGSNDKDNEGWKSPFELGVPALVQITGQQISQTKENGYSQLVLDLALVGEDGETLRKAGKAWVTIPHFSDVVREKLSVEELTAKNKAFSRVLSGLLRAAMPETFETFQSKTDTKPAKYITADGEQLNYSEMVARRSLKERAMPGAANLLVDGKISLVGKRVYVTETAKGTRQDGRPQVYKNFSSKAND